MTLLLHSRGSTSSVSDKFKKKIFLLTSFLKLSNSSSYPFRPFGLSCCSPLVDGLGGDAEFAHAPLTQPQLQVLGKLPPLCQNVLDPLFGELGEVEVADGGVVVVHDVAGPGRGEVTLSAHRHVVLARVQQPPVIPISHCNAGEQKENKSL